MFAGWFQSIIFDIVPRITNQCAYLFRARHSFRFKKTPYRLLRYYNSYKRFHFEQPILFINCDRVHNLSSRTYEHFPFHKYFHSNKFSALAEWQQATATLLDAVEAAINRERAWVRKRESISGKNYSIFVRIDTQVYYEVVTPKSSVSVFLPTWPH